jgi:N-dimethylarginine dimethylaminohydrolase
MAATILSETTPLPTDGRVGEGRPLARRYVMCPPRFFDVAYRINPWMEPGLPVDRRLAVRQWETLRRTLEDLGHEVAVADPGPGLPDMVFAANSALVIGGRVLAARMATPERRGEEERYRAWFASRGYGDVHVPRFVNEGEGDFVVVAGRLLAGSGFRTDPRAHREAEKWFGRPVTSLRLVDPCRYHLDLAVAALDDHTVVYAPDALDAASARVLSRLFPDALVAAHPDAQRFGLNLLSDGRHVLLSASAPGLAGVLRERGYEPIQIDVSELEKAGGSVKCCVLELHQ